MSIRSARRFVLLVDRLKSVCFSTLFILTRVDGRQYHSSIDGSSPKQLGHAPQATRRTNVKRGEGGRRRALGSDSRSPITTNQQRLNFFSSHSNNGLQRSPSRGTLTLLGGANCDIFVPRKTGQSAESTDKENRNGIFPAACGTTPFSADS